MNYKIIDGEKVYGYRWIILALMGLACIVVNGSTLVFAGMAGILLNPTGPWAFDAQQFMMLTSCSYLTGFLFCMVTGTMADRMGIKKVLVIGLAISAIGAILRIFWGGFAGMFVTSVIFDFGLAALNANSAKIISLWFPGKMISVAMGIYLCCATVGCALAVPLAGMATEPTPVFVAVAVLSVIVVVLWADRKLRLSDALVFLGTLVLTALPALLGGKSIGALLSIYTAQTGLYTGLTYNAPSFFALMNTTGLDVYAYGHFGMALAFGVCALLVSAGVKRAGRMTRAGYLRLALLLPLAIVFFLPRMHERYFYLADILSVALAAYDKKAAPVCVLAVFASFSCYWETLFSLPVCALMMLAALILILRHTQRDENVI